MYEAKYTVRGRQYIISNLDLVRAVVYKRRWRKRGVVVEINKLCNVPLDCTQQSVKKA
jgi:aryl carrier-like protein